MCNALPWPFTLEPQNVPAGADRTVAEIIRSTGHIAVRSKPSGNLLREETRNELGVRTAISVTRPGEKHPTVILSITCLVEPSHVMGLRVDMDRDAVPTTLSIEGIDVRGLMRCDTESWDFDGRDITTVGPIAGAALWRLMIGGQGWFPVPLSYRLVPLSRYSLPGTRKH